MIRQREMTDIEVESITNVYDMLQSITESSNRLEYTRCRITSYSTQGEMSKNVVAIANSSRLGYIV